MEKLQVLVATMKQSDFSKIKEMNLSTAAVIANQADDTRYDETQISGHTIKMITTTTRGVGINRNIALSYADGDILLLADDDVKYKDSYSNLVLDAFRKVPEADALIFNIDIIGLDKAGRKNTAIKRQLWCKERSRPSGIRPFLDFFKHIRVQLTGIPLCQLQHGTEALDNIQSGNRNRHAALRAMLEMAGKTAAPEIEHIRGTPFGLLQQSVYI